MKTQCQHKWEKRRVCPDDCNVPLAGGVEDLTGGFCYGKDPNECNFPFMAGAAASAAQSRTSRQIGRNNYGTFRFEKRLNSL